MKLTLEQAGRLAGIQGKNPARTWQRWERGEREPSLKAIAAIESASKGTITVHTWTVIRDSYEASQRLAA